MWEGKPTDTGPAAPVRATCLTVDWCLLAFDALISGEADTTRKEEKSWCLPPQLTTASNPRRQGEQWTFLFADSEMNAEQGIFMLLQTLDELEGQQDQSHSRQMDNSKYHSDSWQCQITLFPGQRASRNALKTSASYREILKYLSYTCSQRLSAEAPLWCGLFSGQNYPVSSEPSQIDCCSFSQGQAPLEDPFSQQRWHTIWLGSEALCKMKHN